MNASHHFVRVDFTRFKAFRQFTLHLRDFNILVGPNNAGKSTVLAAFRILATAMRRACTRKPDIVEGPDGPTPGYHIDVSSISVAEENIFYNYDYTKSASVAFQISNGNELLLHFGESGHCVLIARCDRSPLTPSTFQRHFDCPIGFAPILGPVDHNERLLEKEAARRALFNYTASRNFRNIWYHYPARFDEFRTMLSATWPGMDVQPPELDLSDGRPMLLMHCPEERIPREIFWAGFGFQVWCQMLTHIIQSSDKSLFLIDEPDIYLHSDLQRQLLGLLRNLGPDIIVATHSTEIITEAEPDDIVLIDKRRSSGRRLRDPSQLANVFSLLGSTLNPFLTQLAKTRRALFVEGRDFQIIGRFAQRLGTSRVSNRANFAVVPVDDFSPDRFKSLKAGMETTLGSGVQAAVILNRDYRCEAERRSIADDCKSHCTFVKLLARKEVENFLLIPDAIDRAASRKLADRARRTGETLKYGGSARDILDEFANAKKPYVTSQMLAEHKRFDGIGKATSHETRTDEAVLREIEQIWRDFGMRMSVIPGKEALSFINEKLQHSYSVSVTPSAIIDSMREDEIPAEMRELISSVADFAENIVPE